MKPVCEPRLLLQSPLPQSSCPTAWLKRTCLAEVTKGSNRKGTSSLSFEGCVEVFQVEKDARVGKGEVISLSLFRHLESLCWETDFFFFKQHFGLPQQSREEFIQIAWRTLTAHILGKMGYVCWVQNWIFTACFIWEVSGDGCKSLAAALEFLWLLQKYLKHICLACSSVCCNLSALTLWS